MIAQVAQGEVISLCQVLTQSISASEATTSAYRSTGSIPVPVTRCSTQFTSPLPVLPATMRGPDKNYAVQVKFKLRQAKLEKLEDIYETVPCLMPGLTELTGCKQSIQPRSTASLLPKVVRPILHGKAQTREPDVVKEIKRGSMKDKWGLSLSYRITDLSLELVVTSVAKYSPADKVEIKEGNIITRVNDWKIEAMDHPQAALSILQAGGFFLSVGWLAGTMEGEGWVELGSI